PTGDSDLHRFAMERLGQTRDPRAIDKLLEAIEKAPRGRWRPLVTALQKVGGSRLPLRLGELMGGRRAEIRAMALEVFSGLPEWRDHINFIKLAMRDEEEAIRVRAVQVLGQDARDPAVRSLLIELMYATDDGLRGAAIEALAKAPDLDIIEDFFDLLADQKPKLQELMIRGLRQMLSASKGRVSDSVLEAMLPLLAADDKRIREAAAQLLAAMPDSIHVLRRFLQYAKGIAFWLRDRSFAAVQTVAHDIVEAILTLINDNDVDVITGAIVMASNSRDPRLFEALRTLLDREFDWWIKVPALETLATFQHDGVHDLLVSKMHDPDLGPAAVACLGARAEPRGLQPLLDFLGSERRGLRRAALTALANYREPMLVEVLQQVAGTDTDDECRSMALERLDSYGAEGVAAAAAIRDELAKLAPGADVPIELSMKSNNLD
ncbi:MAG: HEAT repeat domain-containing protein, partial [Planctomycetota bacterium]|nr:HEAT repeat domain-containing protein [Planctomycetota bacterium]